MSPKKKPGLGLFRFLTPGQMAICLALFFMPWVEVQCGMPNPGKLGGNIGDPNAPPPKITSNDLIYTRLVTQSGYQAAVGEYSFDDQLQEMMNQKMGGAAKEEKKEDVDGAPVLFLFPIAALAAVVLGLVLPAGGIRKFVLVLCCGLALASAGTQAAVGFPITEDVKKNPEVAGPGKQDDLGGLKPDDIIRTRYLVPFYLALLLAVGGLVTSLIEPTAPPKPKRRRYEDDDDFDDDRDRERDRDDDDSEERPRRRRERAEEDDSEERPRRKRERDREDDSDDRPRRKRSESDNPFENLE